MSKVISNAEEPVADDVMKPIYDFSQGIRGKHYKAYRRGHTVTIHQTDGTQTTQYFGLKDGAVMLDPDVSMHFPTSEAVNEALRRLLKMGKFSPTP